MVMFVRCAQGSLLWCGSNGESSAKCDCLDCEKINYVFESSYLVGFAVSTPAVKSVHVIFLVLSGSLLRWQLGLVRWQALGAFGALGLSRILWDPSGLCCALVLDNMLHPLRQAVPSCS